MRIKIHPSIGVARLGNSPTEFFIGPEKPGETFSSEQPGATDPQKFRYKDSQGRIKRQAARFRLFSYDDAGKVVKELKPGVNDVASVEWIVHLRNSKGAGLRFYDEVNEPNAERNAGVPREEVTIDPGPQSVKGKGQGPVVLQGKFMGETVVLGDLRTDAEGRLLVLGGFGKAGSPKGTALSSKSEDFADHDDWYDDVADGSVRAIVTFKDGSQNTEVVPAWVVVAPPDFAPPLNMITTLYDLLFQLAVEKKLAYLDSGETLSAPAKPSFKRDIAPILRRALDMRWVINDFKLKSTIPHHTFESLFSSKNTEGLPFIVNFLRDPNTLVTDNPEDVTPGADMPRLWGDRHRKGPKLTVTKTQYANMKKWGGTVDAPGKAGTDWVNDWDEPEPPAQVTARGLDRAALDSCIGGAFYPGLETARFIRDGAEYLEPFRLSEDTEPGKVTQGLALPWKYDFAACHVEKDVDLKNIEHLIYWWPAQRPDFVVFFDEQGALKQDNWTRTYVNDQPLEMVRRWHHLGFVVQKGDKYLETERNREPVISWPTSPINFLPVEKDFYAAAPFEAKVLSDMSVTFRIIDLAPKEFFTAPQSEVVVTAGEPPQSKTARLWIQFKGGDVIKKTEGHVTVRAFQTDHEECGFGDTTIPLTAETKPRPACATVLALDRSGSMKEQVAAGKNKMDKLREAAATFVEMLRDGDGVGLVQYNHKSEPGADLLKEVVKVDTQTAQEVAGIIKSKENLIPTGETSIGAGVLLGNSTLKPTAGQYPRRALLVLTDGEENFPPTIAAAKMELQQGGAFPNIYAVGIGQPEDISYAALDNLTTPPEPTAEQEAAEGYLLVTGDLEEDKFRLQKYFLQALANINLAQIVLDPAGELAFGADERVPFNMTEADRGMDVILLSPSPRALDFRLETPAGKVIGPAEAFKLPESKFFVGDAVSYYRLFFSDEELEKERAGRWHALLRANLPDDKSSTQAPAGASSVSYRLLVHAYSNLRFRASLRREGYGPGRVALVRASLTEYGIPLAGAARVWAEVTDPFGRPSEVALAEVAPGQFEVAVRPKKEGVYALRVRAAGATSRASLFSREQTLTAGVGRALDRVCPPARKGCLPGLLGRLFWPR